MASFRLGGCSRSDANQPARASRPAARRKPFASSSAAGRSRRLYALGFPATSSTRSRGNSRRLQPPLGDRRLRLPKRQPSQRAGRYSQRSRPGRYRPAQSILVAIGPAVSRLRRSPLPVAHPEHNGDGSCSARRLQPAQCKPSPAFPPLHELSCLIRIGSEVAALCTLWKVLLPRKVSTVRTKEACAWKPHLSGQRWLLAEFRS